MARMIPSNFNDSKTSEGEIKLFRALEELPDEYVVLHSLGMANHQYKVYGEIDFVVIGTEGVLCLEVKGGRVYRRNGEWHFVNRFGRDNMKVEGPFDQGISAMHSLRGLIVKRFGKNHPHARCLYATGVVIPDMEFTQTGPDIIPEIVFDSSKTFNFLQSYIKSVFAYWREAIRGKHGFVPSGLSKDHIQGLTDYLRGDFGYASSLTHVLDQTEKGIIRLTEEQVDRLEIASGNPRILLMGAAGTGKTVLSMEFAKRCALTGKRVLFLCFNRMLANVLRSNQDEDIYQENLLIRHFHGFLYDEVSKYYLLNDRPRVDDLFRNVLPTLFCEIYHSYSIPQFDVVVIDEGQDLIRDEYLICVDTLLKGGLESGHWHISYDPLQNIYTDSSQLSDGLTLLESNCVKLHLDTNCRNTRPIGVYTTLLTGINPAIRFKLDGLGVEKIAYEDSEDERRQIIKRVRNLLGQGVKPSSICILSNKTLENSCLRSTDAFSDVIGVEDISNYSHNIKILSNSKIRFSTIHSFKGMESPVIILADVEGFKEPYQRILNYVAMSRARSMLYIYYKTTVEDELTEVIEQSASNLDAMLNDHLYSVG